MFAFIKLSLIFILKNKKRSQNDLYSTLVFASFFWIVFRSVFANIFCQGQNLTKKQNAQNKNFKKTSNFERGRKYGEKTKKERIAT